jgi:hypothetical protein
MESAERQTGRIGQPIGDERNEIPQPAARDDLVRQLTALKMPEPMARQHAGLDDNLKRLDQILSNIVANIASYCRNIRRAADEGDWQARTTYSTYLQAAMLTVEAYKDEIVQRRLPYNLVFPRTAKAMQESIDAVNGHKDELFAAMGRTGRCND